MTDDLGHEPTLALAEHWGRELALCPDCPCPISDHDGLGCSGVIVEHGVPLGFCTCSRRLELEPAAPDGQGEA